MNIRLWELDNGDLINLTDIQSISVLHEWNKRWYLTIKSKTDSCNEMAYKTKDEAKLARFKIVERWNACLDMIHNQEWVPEAGTFSSSSKPIKEDKFNGYKESDISEDNNSRSGSKTRSMGS